MRKSERFVLEIHNPDGTVTQLGDFASINDEMAKASVTSRIRRHARDLNLYAEVVALQPDSGRLLFDEPQTVEGILTAYVLISTKGWWEKMQR